MAPNLYPLLGCSAPFDASNAHVTSPVLPPFALALARLLLGSYTLVTLLFTLIYAALHDHYANDYFSYFTHLTYIGLCAYFFAAGAQTLAYSRDGAAYPLQRWPRALQALHVVLQVTITTYRKPKPIPLCSISSPTFPRAAVVVTIVFWALLASPTTFQDTETAWSNISMHILNLVFALCEVLLTNIPPAPWLTLPLAVLLLACYLAVAYITHADQGIYRAALLLMLMLTHTHSLTAYAFLDPVKQKGLLGAYIVAILACYCIVFVIVRFLIVARIRLLARKRGNTSLVLAESLTEWEEVAGAGQPKGPGPAAVAV
ncbi:hypothetical protein C0992_007320 [Termitomyces sp. T32_za158]|nr:hypothetical protein C0992_007320 [Termitomyces sp. T32_za158]